MFGRRGTDGDLVAAAQRRLAALNPIADDDGGGGGAFGDRPSAESLAPPPTPGTTRVRPSGQPRHLGVSRGDLQQWLGITAQQLTVAALVLVALVVAVAWWALRSTPHEHSIQLSSERLPSATATPGPPSSEGHPAPPSSAGDATPSGGSELTGGPTRLVVDVAGKVRHPGIVELPAGSRVVDAIAAAGGARPGVSLMSLNLARPLVDGEQIVVGIDVPVSGGDLPLGQPSATSAGETPAAVDLNTATAEQLDTLPGVGPVTAQAILQWRADNGPFLDVEQLLDVSGIGEATLADLRAYVYV